MKKTALSLLFVAAIAVTAFADIQDPPMNEFGPTRKLGRALGNLAWGVTEIPVSIAMINERDDNQAAASYGIVKGVGRMLYRIHNGVVELFTFPFPTYKGSYRPPYKQTIPWLHGGYEEFPPEMGWQTRYRYSRMNLSY